MREERPDRFAFGRNWQQYLATLTADQIRAAELALRHLVTLDTLAGRRFLDIGSGSGVHSLAAHRMGAIVVSFDDDADSVACTRALKSRYAPDDDQWRIERGSVLDETYMRALGRFDIVYAWGVLHHTGQMWSALDNALLPVKAGGLFVLALYNRHWTSPLWKGVKALYNRTPDWLRPAWFSSIGVLKVLGAMLTTGKRPQHRERGMRFRHDLIDWLGGYPYEYASIAEVTAVVERAGFQTRLVLPTVGWTGCHQFIFRKDAKSNHDTPGAF